MSAPPVPLGEAVRRVAEEVERRLDEHPDPELLAAYARGELAPEEREAIEEHLTWCRGDAALVRDFGVLRGEGAEGAAKGQVSAGRGEAEAEHTGASGGIAPGEVAAAWGRFLRRRDAAVLEIEEEAAGPAAPPTRDEGGAPMVVAEKTSGQRARETFDAARQALPVAPAAWRRVASSPTTAYALAASLLVAAGLALGWGWDKDRRLRQAQQPSTDDAYFDLVPEASERGEPQRVVLPIASPERGAFLILNPSEPLPGGEYEVRILDAHGRQVWSAPAQPRASETFELTLPAGFLNLGAYRIEVVAKGSGGEAPLGRYPVEVVEGTTQGAGTAR